MRTHPHFPRVRELITDPIVPRLANGGLALCHLHQRTLANCGGFNEMLCRQIKLEASNHAGLNKALTESFERRSCPKCGSENRYFISTRNNFKCKDCHTQYGRTSKTQFASMKLPPEKMKAIVDDLKQGVAMTTVANRHGVQTRSVWYIKSRIEQ